MSPRLPLCARDEILEELTLNNQDLERLSARPPVSADAEVARAETLRILLGWRTDLLAQLDEMSQERRGGRT